MPAAQLFDLFEAMIKPFGDAYTFINAPKLKRRFRGIRPGTDRVVNELAGKDGFDKSQKRGMRKGARVNPVKPGADLDDGGGRLACSRSRCFPGR
jgi:hypothetical protein